MDSTLNLIERISKVVVFQRGNQRAPHKPLYMLYCISKIQASGDRLQPFDQVRGSLAPALRAFAPRTASVHPEYPFWRLQHDGLAEVVADGPLDLRESNSDPTVASLRKQRARGGLLAHDFEMLSGNLQLQSLAIHKILDAHFPPSVHDELIRFFNLRLDDRHACDKVSDIAFRNTVLAAYSHRCALTGFNLDAGGQQIGLEAAHIIWPQVGGNDLVGNGIAMTVLHRKLFHLGLFAISSDFRIEVASNLRAEGRSALAISNLNGKRITLPTKAADQPTSSALAWHRKWVFRG